MDVHTAAEDTHPSRTRSRPTAACGLRGDPCRVRWDARSHRGSGAPPRAKRPIAVGARLRPHLRRLVQGRPHTVAGARRKRAAPAFRRVGRRPPRRPASHRGWDAQRGWRARDLHAMRRNVGRGGAAGITGRRPSLRAAAHLVAGCRRRKRLSASRVRGGLRAGAAAGRSFADLRDEREQDGTRTDVIELDDYWAG